VTQSVSPHNLCHLRNPSQRGLLHAFSWLSFRTVPVRGVPLPAAFESGVPICAGDHLAAGPAGQTSFSVGSVPPGRNPRGSAVRTAVGHGVAGRTVGPVDTVLSGRAAVGQTGSAHAGPVDVPVVGRGPADRVVAADRCAVGLAGRIVLAGPVGPAGLVDPSVPGGLAGPAGSAGVGPADAVQSVHAVGLAGRIVLAGPVGPAGPVVPAVRIVPAGSVGPAGLVDPSVPGGLAGPAGSAGVGPADCCVADPAFRVVPAGLADLAGRSVLVHAGRFLVYLADSAVPVGHCAVDHGVGSAGNFLVS